ncbi:leucine-rich repeat domain-containing protein [Simkania sp.]|uniref:leucine-rich repeat domain-containing protein n=1 Tax=Simkania sp. TaxID=34094 RepID=UPI003B5246FA
MAIKFLTGMVNLVWSSSESPSQGEQLSRELKKMQAFLPTPEITNFNPSNVTLNFDIKRLDATNLSALYDTMASSFWFSHDVQDLYIKAKSAFTLAPPDFDGTTEEGVGHCLKMAELINEIAPDVMDRNLARVWGKLEDQYKFPHFETAAEMREYLSKGNKQKVVTLLDLSRSEIEIVPPEILQFPRLSQVVLYDTKLGQFPHVLKAHQSLDPQKILCEDLTFNKGTAAR